MEIMMPVYHGTNTKALNMTKNEIENARLLSRKILDISYSFLLNKYFIEKGFSEKIVDDYSDKILKELSKNNEELALQYSIEFNKYFSNCNSNPRLANVFRMSNLAKRNEEYFQYSNFYVTNVMKIAEGYAKRGKKFGELTDFAEILLEEASKYSDFYEQLDISTKEDVANFIEFCKSEGSPIVLKYEDIPENYFLLENGKEMTDDDWNLFYQKGMSLRAKKDINDYIVEEIEI